MLFLIVYYYNCLLENLLNSLSVKSKGNDLYARVCSMNIGCIYNEDIRKYIIKSSSTCIRKLYLPS